MNDIIEFTSGLFTSKNSDIFNSKEFLSAIVGAIIGAFGSGIVTFVMQLYTNRQAKELRLEERHAVKSALAHTLLYKLVRICSGASAIYNHLNKSIEISKKKDPSTQPWQAVPKLANTPIPVTVSVEELGIIYELNDNEMSTSLIMIDEVFSRLITLSETINSLKEDVSRIVKILPGSGGEFSISVPLERRGEFDKTIFELDGVIQSALEDSGVVFRELSKIIQKVQPILKEKYGIEYVYRMTDETKKAI
ncbi:hypothetical protein J8I29_19285 [Labrys sp. LIt4]|uniref:hypothetical protein n=1 Tax=Labrys sp. LIt4 TaxID=2821355 RepID=UPI001ADFEAF7|nr:hypothetical protein [Labrys sp. LIt4]MBP0581481.1 hypothetical protein [Labrys sp. LIt4]